MSTMRNRPDLQNYNRGWTREDETFLLTEVAKGRKVLDVAADLGRSGASCSTRISKLAREPITDA